MCIIFGYKNKKGLGGYLLDLLKGFELSVKLVI